ncbi:MAG: cold shock domain-containing protein [Bdellovibrionales bacterium]|nr:cold shock domain-containing protein [Bdellovibrionales bacterium]
MAELQRGVVKWFNDAKGFGFIEHTSGRDVFVHYSVIEWDGFKTLKDGEEVDYELKEGDKGLHAAKVVRTAAAKKKAEKAEQEAQTMVAPNLESGSVNTGIRSAASMIEVEHARPNAAEIRGERTAEEEGTRIEQ